MRTLLIALAAFGYAGSAAYAQEFPPVYVMAEYDDEEADECQITNTSLVAAVESELRYNRISVGTMEQALRNQAFRVYISSVVLEDAGSCIVAYSLSFGSYQPVTLMVTGETTNEQIVLCDKSGVMTGPAYDLQSRLNASYRDMTSVCISEYLKE